MKPYLVKTPSFVKRIYANRIWNKPTDNANSVFLTFDDGPVPEVTPWVLHQLQEHHVKATFFCIGDNVRKHPEIFKQIVSEGHSVGNHTMHHLNGWDTNLNQYLDNVNLAEAEMDRWTKQQLRLFRPPYGKLSSRQSKALQKKGYQIIMWEVLSADFDWTISEEKCLRNVIDNIQPGSILVFHDSLKAQKNLRYTLPKVLEYIGDKNWKCEAI